MKMNLLKFEINGKKIYSYSNYRRYEMNDYLQLIEDKGIENLDFVIDKITESKYFAGFPIVSQLLGIIKLSKAIPNYLYAKKHVNFLME